VIKSYVPRFESKGDGDTIEEEERQERKEVAASFGDTVVVIVLQSRDDSGDDGRRNDDRKDLRCPRYKCLRISGKDRCSSLWSWGDCADAMAGEVIDRRNVVGIYQTGTDKSAQELRKDGDWELPPGQATKQAVGEGDGGI